MIYLDTSVAVALIVPEPASDAVSRWYAALRTELVTTAWCVTEFASALGIKQRTRQLDATQAAQAWGRFERLVADDLVLLPVEAGLFHRAAMLALDATRGLRAGDALHLAAAEQAGAKAIATLDAALADSARRLKIRPLSWK